MKKIIIIVLAGVFVAGPVFAEDVYVSGYYTKRGTYVQGHHRSSPDSNKLNNYSTQGNVNPYTGQYGTVNPYNHPTNNPYNQHNQNTGFEE